MAKEPMDLSIFTINDDPSIKPYLKTKYPDLKNKALKAAMKAFLLPGMGAHEVGFLRNKILVEAVGNKP